jgi:hypothetical protein
VTVIMTRRKARASARTRRCWKCGSVAHAALFTIISKSCQSQGKAASGGLSFSPLKLRFESEGA